MKTAILLWSMIILSSCAVNPSVNDKTLMEQYPNCINRENFFRMKQPENNCIVMVRLKKQAQVKQTKTHQRNVERDMQLRKQRTERDKWEAEKKKQKTIEALEIVKFNSLLGLTYDDFITKVIENPDDIGWSSKVKTRYGKNPPFMPVVKQQVGTNYYIVQSMFARDDPNQVFLNHKGRLLLVNSLSTLIKGIPINRPHILRYDGVTTISTVIGVPQQVIAVTLTKNTK
jgi:hypothetical protein